MKSHLKLRHCRQAAKQTTMTPAASVFVDIDVDAAGGKIGADFVHFEAEPTLSLNDPVLL